MEPAGDGSAVRRTEQPAAIAGDEEVINGTGPEQGRQSPRGVDRQYGYSSGRI